MKVKYLKFNTKRRFGVEIELNRHLSQQGLREVVGDVVGYDNTAIHGWGYTCNNTQWIIKPDSSCGDLGNKNKDGGGYEVASAVGKGAKHLTHIAKVTRALQVSPAQTNKHCAFHCQVEIKDFSRDRAAILLAYWCKIEKCMAQMVPRLRAKSKYCKPFTGTKGWPYLREIRYASDFWKSTKLKGLAASDKRNSITLVNFQRTLSTSYQWENFHRPTVELRYPESSLRSYDTKNWTRLFVHFVESCNQRHFPNDLEPVGLREMLIILGLKDDKRFAILSPGLFETKFWLLHRLNLYAKDKSLRSDVLEEARLMNNDEIDWLFDFPKVTPPSVTKPKNRRTIKSKTLGVASHH